MLKAGAGRARDASSGEELGWWEAPDELICPITHALFRSPVVTVAGTVYEEAAIAQHLAATSKDPLTNQPLRDHKLTPVFLLRSRAEQYAIATASACVRRTLQADCPDPARYLRRACELADEAGVVDSVPELPARVVAFALQHRGGVHDVFVLLHFATCLATSGHRDRALVLFSTLLRLERERPVQIAVVKRCLLHCWCARSAGGALEHADDGTAPCVGGALTMTRARRSDEGAAGGDAAEAARCGGASAALDVAAVADFAAAQQGLTPAAFLQILRGLCVPGPQLIRLCAVLLRRAAESDGGDEGSPAALPAAAALGVVPFMVDAVADELRKEMASAVASRAGSAADAEGRRVALDRASRSCVGQGSGQGRPWRGAGRVCAITGALLGALLPYRAGRVAAAVPLLWLVSRQKG